MSLGIKGNSKDIEELMNEAKRRNLTVVLYSENPDSLEKLLGISTEKKPTSYEMIQGYLQYHAQKGRRYIPQKELSKKLGFTKVQISVAVRRMEKERILERTPIEEKMENVLGRKGNYKIRLLKYIPEEQYQRVLPYVMGIK
jgi:predicted transcriptional regulator